MIEQWGRGLFGRKGLRVKILKGSEVRELLRIGEVWENLLGTSIPVPQSAIGGQNQIQKLGPGENLLKNLVEKRMAMDLEIVKVEGTGAIEGRDGVLNKWSAWQVRNEKKEIERKAKEVEKASKKAGKEKNGDNKESKKTAKKEEKRERSREKKEEKRQRSRDRKEAKRERSRERKERKKEKMEREKGKEKSRDVEDMNRDSSDYEEYKKWKAGRMREGKLEEGGEASTSMEHGVERGRRRDELSNCSHSDSETDTEHAATNNRKGKENKKMKKSKDEKRADTLLWVVIENAV